MRISLLSSSQSCRSSARGVAALGFSLIELLISAAIIALISAIVIVKFTSFDSSVLLKSLAYEVASVVRNAQVYSVSVVRNTEGFGFAYGMHFSSASKQYTFFRYTGANQTVVPQYLTNTTDINTFTIGRNMQVSALCVKTAGDNTCHEVTSLDISFRRPEFRALFHSNSGSITDANIESAQIRLNSTGNTNFVWVVEVSLLGQITVFKL